jgi:dihydrolipoamide dehydrogenase
MKTRITIIGAGPGGYVAAVRAAQLGAEVTIIEQEEVGGTCVNWGCIPSKVLKTTADMLSRFRCAEDFGIMVDGTFYPDMELLMSRKREVVRHQISGIRRLLDRHGVRLEKGFGFVKAAGVTIANHPDGTSAEIPWDELILAPGTRAANIPALTREDPRVWSSNDALECLEVPRSIVILGGGVIGCEFACIFSQLGSRVAIVEAMPRLLPHPSIDEACSKVLQREMKKQKIALALNRTVREVQPAGDGGLRITLEDALPPDAAPGKDSGSEVLEAERLLVCVGRRPNTDGMGLSEMGVETSEQGWILVDERMATCVPHVYAIGDALGPARIMLAHVASAEGRTAAENAMSIRRSMDYTAVPSAIFTAPEVANVGLSEAQAGELGHQVRSETVLFRNLGKAHAIGEIAGEAKIVADSKNGKVLGVHIVGPHATDLIAEGTLAVNTGITVKEVAETIHAHPTLSEIMLEGSLKALGRGVHG